MPEGPEHYKTSVFINKVCRGRCFNGTIKKSAVSKQSDIDFNVEKYTIYAKSRGKELMLILTELVDDSVPLSNANVVNGVVVKGGATSIKNKNLPMKIPSNLKMQLMQKIQQGKWML